jgi:Fe-S-cluster-containing dehydrogenase component
MKRWNLVIDVALCENCNNCVLAARDELTGNTHAGYSAPHAATGAAVVRIDRKLRGATPMVDAAYLPQLCNHCDDAPCMRAAGDDSIRKRDDGIVIIDPVKAKGRRDLVEACPYGAIVWNEQQQLPQHWFFDAHLLDKGAVAPRCVPVCPTAAIEAVKIEDAAMQQRAAEEELRVLRPELGTRPRVWYRNLWRYDQCFIGGTVTQERDGVEECAAGVTVGLLHEGAAVATATTDAFGDFKFDRLKPHSGSYVVRVAFEASTRDITVPLQDESLYLGVIQLR